MASRGQLRSRTAVDVPRGTSFRVCVEGHGPRCGLIAASLGVPGRDCPTRSVVLGHARAAPLLVASRTAVRAVPYGAVLESDSGRVRETVVLGLLLCH